MNETLRVVLAALIVGGAIVLAASLFAPRYSIVYAGAGEGLAYRLDNRTGEVAACLPGRVGTDYALRVSCDGKQPQ